MREYFVGETILVLPGTELNYGLHEDSDLIVLEVPELVIVLGPVASGAMKVSLPFHLEIQPLYFHQPESKVVLP